MSDLGCIEEKCVSKNDCPIIKHFYEKGRSDERKKIMEIVDGADDIAQAMYLLGQYIISEELKEKKEEEYE